MKLTIRIIRDFSVYSHQYRTGDILQDGKKNRFFKSPPRLIKTANGFRHGLHFIPAANAEEISEEAARVDAEQPNERAPMPDINKVMQSIIKLHKEIERDNWNFKTQQLTAQAQEKNTMETRTNKVSDMPDLFDLPGLSEPATERAQVDAGAQNAEPADQTPAQEETTRRPYNGPPIFAVENFDLTGTKKETPDREAPQGDAGSPNAEPAERKPAATETTAEIAEKWPGIDEIDPTAKAQKWTNASGPRKAKPTIELLKRLNRTKSEMVEINGTRPNTDRRVYALLFGPPVNMAACRLYIFIGRKYNWTITDANRAGLNNDILEAIKAAQEARPVEDKSKSAEEAAQDNEKYEAIKAKQEAARAEIASQEAAELAELEEDTASPRSGARLLTKKGNPHMSDHAIAAANIKLELQAKFPGVKFSVISDSFSGGNSVTAKWTDGPTEEEAREIINYYQHGNFDGMTDMYNYKRVTGHKLYGSAKYTSSSREISFIDELTAAVCEYFKVDPEADAEKWIDGSSDSPRQIARRISYRASLKGNERYTGITTESGSREGLKITTETTGPAPTEQAAQEAGATGARVTVKHNTEQNGIEIHFTAKPDPATLEEIKAQRYRWSRRQKIWYTKYTADKMDRARAMADRVNGTAGSEAGENDSSSDSNAA